VIIIFRDEDDLDWMEPIELFRESGTIKSVYVNVYNGKIKEIRNSILLIYIYHDIISL
jgi:hypothetical protein